MLKDGGSQLTNFSWLTYDKLADFACCEIYSKLTVFLELRSRKTVRFSEQIMPADKYPSIFSRQMKAIVYILRGVIDISVIAACLLRTFRSEPLVVWKQGHQHSL